jgi:hypothetical protein
MQLHGVHRPLNSLLWDATLEPPASQTQQVAYNSGFLEGFAREAVWLGKFATREQAGRAADLAALKLLGSNAQVGPGVAYDDGVSALCARVCVCGFLSCVFRRGESVVVVV